jgi:hypothetical protein
MSTVPPLAAQVIETRCLCSGDNKKALVFRLPSPSPASALSSSSSSSSSIKQKQAVVSSPPALVVDQEEKQQQEAFGRVFCTNGRDDLGSFDEKDSTRQAVSPTRIGSGSGSLAKNRQLLSPAAASSTTKKRKATVSFDETASTESGKEEASSSVQIKNTHSRDSGSLPSFDSTDAPLIRLENVTALSRSLISTDLQQLLHKPPLYPSTNKTNKRFSRKMTTPAVTNGNGNGGGGKKRGMFRKRLSLRRNSSQEEKVNESPAPSTTSVASSSSSRRASTQADSRPPTRPSRRLNSKDDDEPIETPASDAPPTSQRSNRKTTTDEPERGRSGVLQRLRSASRSRSKARLEHKVGEQVKPILVAVTSCRSDAYYNQKAPGSTSKLPRKAPSNLKLFHELAVGIKDAYAAVGQTPTRPDEEPDEVKENAPLMEGKTVLWEFVGNLDFVSLCVAKNIQKLSHLSRWSL